MKYLDADSRFSEGKHQNRSNIRYEQRDEYTTDAV